MKICSALLSRLVEGFDSPYYSIAPGTPIREVSRLWAKERKKAYDDSMPVWYSAEEVWPYREYEWGGSYHRGSNEEWAALRVSMAAKGWNPDEPCHVAVGKDGKVRVGEGNHRLAIARALGLKVPVWFHFQDRA